MKRLLLTAVLGGAALLPLAAPAQRTMGGRMSGPPARSGSGFAARPMPAARFNPGFVSRPVPTFRTASPQGRVFFSTGPFRHNHVGFREFRRFPERRFFSSNVCFNGGFGGPFVCGGSGFFGGGVLYAPPYPLDYAYTYAPPQPQTVVVDDSNSRELSLQVERLSDEVEMMREEDRRREEDRVPASQPQSKPTVQSGLPNTVIVLRDGRQLSVRNYAIVGSTVWILNERTARKIPLSDLDLPATEEANTRNGIDFRVPASQPH